MSFDPREIKTMLLAYKTESRIDFDTTDIARLIHRFTNGYPYLVSDICKIIDEKLAQFVQDQGLDIEHILLKFQDFILWCHKQWFDCKS